ncbi:MAG TPA: hypothetical protein VFS39_02195 [Nitrospira sp.]|nr:hypothetical protein [Nitrospira sp.]
MRFEIPTVSTPSRMKELEVKADTKLTGRSSPLADSGQTVWCAVDECLHKALANYEVTVTNEQLAPASESHWVPLCGHHAKAPETLKWEWRRTAEAPAGQRLELVAVFALDTIEDRSHT